MKPLHWLTGLLLIVAAALPAKADEKDDGFVPLFNGRDLTGWVNVNCAPSTFYVKDSEIITTGKPTGYLRTAKQYENFIADFEWMHVPPAPGEVGNSGFFVWADPLPAVGSGYTRGIEVQVLVNLTYTDRKTGQLTATSQGDLFSIWGATCVPDRPHPLGWARRLPSENRCKGAGEWNHYRVEANDGVLKLAVNGKVVSGLSRCNPRKGYLALESEGSECHFRNLRIKELPSTNPKPTEIAHQDMGFQNLYTGLDLSGWKADAKAQPHWQPRDHVLHYDGKSEAMDRALRTAREFGDAEFRVDFRFPPTKDKDTAMVPCEFVLRDAAQGYLKITIRPADGQIQAHGKLSEENSGTEQGSGTYVDLKRAGQWNRLQVALKGPTLGVTVNGAPVGQLKQTLPAPAKGTFALRPGRAMDFANVFVHELK
jgi:hypothetical protein